MSKNFNPKKGIVKSKFKINNKLKCKIYNKNFNKRKKHLTIADI